MPVRNATRLQRSDGEELVTGLLHAGWDWRVELSLLGGVACIDRYCAYVLGGEFAGGLATAGLLAGGYATRLVRQFVAHRLYVARVRRAFQSAVRSLRLPGHGFGPAIRRVKRISAGDQFELRIPKGGSVTQFEVKAEELAACLGVREVKFERSSADASRAQVTLARKDPFADTEAIGWPSVDAEGVSLWDSIPLGVDDNGDTVFVDLAERNILLGGEPGSGKSAALSTLVATAALDRSAKLWLLDGKLVELAAWAPNAEQVVGTDMNEALVLLRALQREMEDRYRELLARGLRKVRREDDLPLHLVVCDELAFYLSAPDRNQRTEFAELLRDLVSRGRAAGVIVCAATQKPGSDVIPTALRDLFGFRLALRCNTPQASDTILGQGWATAGHDASVIPGGQRGVGLLLAEDDRPKKLKCFYLDDTDVQTISTRAAAHRADAWLAETNISEVAA